MADNVAITAGSGTSIAADDIGGVLHQRVKLSQGADGSATDVSSAAPLHVTLANTGANATAVKVDNSAVTQPVSGTVTANLSATDNAVLDDIAADTEAIKTAVEILDNAVSGTEVQVDVLTMPTTTVTATDLDIRDLAKATDSVTAAIENAHSADFDTGAGTDTTPALGIAVPASGGAEVITGDATNGLDVDVTRVSGTVTVDSELTTADLDTGAGTDTKAVVGIAVAGNGGSSIVSTANPLPISDAGSTVSIDDGGASITIDGNVGISTGSNVIGKVKLTDGTDDADILDLTNSNPIATAIVDGNGDQITSFGGGTQYTEGDTDATITGTAMLWEEASDTLSTVSASAPLPVEIVAGAGSGGTAAADDADFTAGTTSGTPAMGVYESTPTSVTDGDLGTVGITSGRRLKTSATIDAALPAGTNNIGDVDVLSSALPTGASTSANQTTIIGHLDGVEGLLTTIDTDTGNISTKIDTLAGAVSGTEVQVDVLTMPTVTFDNSQIDIGNLNTDEDSFTAQSNVGLPTMYAFDDTTPASVSEDTVGIARMSANRNQYMTIRDAAGNERGVNVDASNRLQVAVGNTVTVDGSGVTQPVSAASLPLPTGAATSANQTTIIGHLDGVEGLLTTMDADTSTLAGAVSGTEMQADIVAALPAGDNNIGNVDVVTLPALAAGTNAIGKVLPPDTDVTAHTNYAKKYYTNAGAVTDGIVWSPAAGKRWHVVSMFINVSAAATVTLEDDKAGGDEAVWKAEFAANSGTMINFSEMYPLASGEDAADLIVTTSAGNVYITVTGYEV